MIFDSELLWGALITLLGLSLVLKAIFKIDIQFFSIIFGGFLIYWGLTIIFPQLFS
jgi:hypothetical protein